MYDATKAKKHVGIRPEIVDEVYKLQFSAYGYVYLMRAGTTNMYKIGNAKNVQARRKAIQTANPLPIIIVAVLRTTMANMLERKMHAFFRTKRVNGEWFLLTPEDVAAFKAHPLCCVTVPQ